MSSSSSTSRDEQGATDHTEKSISLYYMAKANFIGTMRQVVQWLKGREHGT